MASILSCDNYYKDFSHLSLQHRSDLNFDHPDSIDEDLLLFHIKELLLGRDVSSPNYNFDSHSRSSQVELVHSKKFIIVEGIIVLALKNLNPTLITAFILMYRLIYLLLEGSCEIVMSEDVVLIA